MCQSRVCLPEAWYGLCIRNLPRICRDLRPAICMYVCMYVCTYVCMYVCVQRIPRIYAAICMYAYIYTHNFTHTQGVIWNQYRPSKQLNHMYVYMYVCIQGIPRVHASIDTAPPSAQCSKYTHKCIHTHKHVRKKINTFIHTQLETYPRGDFAPVLAPPSSPWCVVYVHWRRVCNCM